MLQLTRAVPAQGRVNSDWNDAAVSTQSVQAVPSTVSVTPAGTITFASPEIDREASRDVPVTFQTAALLRQSIPGCTEQILPGLYHGEFSINRPDRYAAYLRAMIDGK